MCSTLAASSVTAAECYPQERCLMERLNYTVEYQLRDHISEHQKDCNTHILSIASASNVQLLTSIMISPACRTLTPAPLNNRPCCTKSHHYSRITNITRCWTWNWNDYSNAQAYERKPTRTLRCLKRAMAYFMTATFESRRYLQGMLKST